MLSRQTKSGKTMYVTQYNDVEHASMDVEAIQFLEAGSIDKLVFSPKDNLVFVNVKGKPRFSTYPSNGPGVSIKAVVPPTVPKMKREECLEIARRVKADVDHLVSGLS